MTTDSQKSTTNFVKIPQAALILIREKNDTIQKQSRKIARLERELDSIRKDRDSLRTKLTLISFKLQLSTPRTPAKYDSESGGPVVGAQPPTVRGLASALANKDRSNSVGTPHSDPGSKTNSPGINRQRSISGNARLQRKHSYKHTDEDNKLKKSRAWANAYELSQDLHDKQVEMLERKYGGHHKARRAAKVIQQAFRQYSMNKNFEKLRHEIGERRISRRFCELSRSNTIWTDAVVESMCKMGMQIQHESIHKSESISTLSQHLKNKVVNEESVSQKLHMYHAQAVSKVQQRGLLVKSQTVSSSRPSQNALKDRKPLQRSMGLDLSYTTVSETRPIPIPITIGSTASSEKAEGACHTVVPVLTDETNNNRNSYPELNDSSASDSPQDTPVEPTVDLASVNFENLLEESKETDILNDSFHSDSSQDMTVVVPNFHDTTAFSPLDHSNSSDRTFKHYASQISESTCSDGGSLSGSDIQVRVDDLGEGVFSDNDRTPTAENPDVLTKVYANTEVRLRKRQRANGELVASASPQDNSFSNDYPQENSIQGQTNKKSPDVSPVWKRKSAALSTSGSIIDDVKRMSNISEQSEPESLAESRDGLSSSASSETASVAETMSLGSIGESSGSYYKSVPPNRKDSMSGLSQNHVQHPHSHLQPKMTDRQRKRQYRIGLNLFNKKPEKGIRYLTERRFIDNRPMSVARCLISRKGLSKQMIGEYLGNLQNTFNQEVLCCFSDEIDLAGLQVDVALRKFQSSFRMPGEAQKIERLMEAFANRYCECNPDQIKKFLSPDCVFLLAFAIIMLNTDLHNGSIKPDRRMKPDDFVKNLRGIDDGEDVDRDLLYGVYERIKVCEFKPGSDHVSQVMKVEQMIVGKRPILALPHRRLVCYCRQYEVIDPNKREKHSLHQREVFLFNDLLVVTKIFSKRKNNVTYSFRQSFPLCGMLVFLFETSHYQHGIRLTTNIDNKVLITFNAKNEHDRTKFVEDLKEAILEMNEMEALRIDEELQKQKYNQTHTTYNRHSNDSGVVDIELLRPTDPSINRLSAPECGGLKKSVLSNSLIDLNEAARRGSGGSLDSGMASNSSSSTNSREFGNDPNHVHPSPNLKSQTSGFKIAGLFGKKSKSSKSSLKNNSSEV